MRTSARVMGMMLGIMMILALGGVFGGSAFGDVIIDNGGAGTSSTGTWSISGGTTPYGANSLWARNGATYTWSMSGQPAGVQEVSMWWSAASSRATNILVTITHRDGTTTVYINQQQNAGKWNSLGQYYFNGSGSVKITAANGSTVSTCADAVKFAPVGGGTPSDTIIDNGAPQTSFTGSWSVSGAPGYYGANSVWSRDNTTYTWTFTPIESGNYEVSMWWTVWSSRSTSIPVRVEHAGGTANLVINQQLGGNRWNSLGTYNFQAGTNYRVIITSQPAPSSTCADAVKFSYVSGGGNSAPEANIDSITGTPSQPGDPITFAGSGTDDGAIKAYNWRSDIDGFLSSDLSFTTSTLSEGLHTIFFKVQDDKDVWSKEVTALVVNVGCASPIRIMPLGDSITYGQGEILTGEYTTGYRQPLFTSLVNADYYIDFVGSVRTGSLVVPVFDVQHQGMTGIADNEVAVNVYNWLVQNPADMILLHIGTNAFNVSPADVENILKEIDRYENDHNTSVLVLLARIINRKTFHPDTTTFNNNVQAMAEARIATGDKIVMVDQESALNYPADMFDNLHPKNTGYGKMANVWLNALTGVLPVCDQSAPVIFTQAVTEAAVNQSYSYTVGAIGSPAPTYQLLTKPSGMTINSSTGQISWTPNAGQSGANAVSVQASNLSGTDVQDFSVNVANGIIIDNGDPGTSYTGTWNISGGANPYGTESLWSRDGTKYTWTFTPAVSGNYELAMWWTLASSRSTSVPVAVTYSGGTQTVVINQQANGGKWNVLGTYPFVGGVSYNITITSQPGPSSTCADAVRFVYVSGINLPPTAGADGYTTNEDTSLAVPAPGVLGNDTDPENDALTAVLNTNVSHGTLTLNPDGSFSYVPATNFSGSDSFTYKANDGLLSSNAATVTITVNAVNDPPVAGNDTAQTAINTAVTINVASNDTDSDGTINLATCVISGGPSHGTAVEQGNCTVLYTPTTGYNGQDTFTYTVKDNSGAVSNAATVTVTVSASTNVAPKAFNDSADTTLNTQVTINVVSNDTDSDGTINPATVVVASIPANGTAVAQSNGTVVYTPNAGYTGKDTFTYTVKDNLGGISNAATVTVTVGFVIDNGASGTSSTGSWAVSGGTPPYGANSLWSRDGATYTWRFTPTVSGNYELSMWWTYATSRSDNIPVAIAHWGGTDTYIINQQANAGKWNNLGTYPFVAGQSYNITITSQPNPTSTCADAVRFVHMPGNVAPDATINFITPNPALPGQSVSFSGSGADIEGPITAYSWHSTLDGPLSDQPSFSTSSLSTGIHSILFKVQDSNGVWSAAAQASVDVNNYQVQTTEHIYYAPGYSPHNVMPVMTTLLQSMGATFSNGVWTYINTARNKRYILHPVSTPQGWIDALKTEGAHVVYEGHSNYGLGQNFATGQQFVDQVINDIYYIDDDKIVNTSSPWIHVSVNGMRTGQAYPFWWPIFKDGTSGILPYEFGDPRGIDPPYNYYITYQVPGDPTHHKIQSAHNSAFVRFPDSGKPAWYDPAGNTPDPNNPDHLQYYITNPTPWSPTVEVSGSWTESQTDLGYFKENYRYKAAGSGSSYVKWLFTIPTAGNYKVYAWWPATSGRVTNAPYTVTHAAGSTTVLMNQRLNGSRWNELGEFPFDAGTYSVMLTDNATGGTIAADAIRIGHPDNPPEIVQADFYAFTRSGGVPLDVSFNNQGTGDLTGRVWTFGDGFTNETRDSVDHTYTRAGTFTVSLTVTGPAGSSTRTKTGYITAGTATPPLLAEFSASNRIGGMPRAVTFRDRSSGTIVSRLWDFGDGTTSTLQNPSHTYTAPGNYTVKLTVTDVNNVSVSETKPNFVRVVVYEASIDNVDYPKRHYGSKTLLYRKEIEVPQNQMRYARLFYGGCDSARYYTDTFNRGLLFLATGSSIYDGMPVYVKGYLEGKSDYELWQVLQAFEPLYDYYDFRKPPSQQW